MLRREGKQELFELRKWIIYIVMATIITIWIAVMPTSVFAQAAPNDNQYKMPSGAPDSSPLKVSHEHIDAVTDAEPPVNSFDKSEPNVSAPDESGESLDPLIIEIMYDYLLVRSVGASSENTAAVSSCGVVTVDGPHSGPPDAAPPMAAPSQRHACQPRIGHRLIDALKLTPAQRKAFIAIQRQYFHLVMITNMDQTLTTSQKCATVKSLRDQERRALEDVLDPEQVAILQRWRTSRPAYPPRGPSPHMFGNPSRGFYLFGAQRMCR